MKREYYSASIQAFHSATSAEIIGHLSKGSADAGFAVDPEQLSAWTHQIEILQKALQGKEGKIYFEYSIPRMGRRIDVVLIIEHVIFVLEFKVGAQDFSAYAVDQVLDYALDLSNFHETSHGKYVAPVLISTQAQPQPVAVGCSANNPRLFTPIKCAAAQTNQVIAAALAFADGPSIAAETWEGITIGNAGCEFTGWERLKMKREYCSVSLQGEKVGAFLGILQCFMAYSVFWRENVFI